MPKTKEYDPLLPPNEPAPEILGQGYGADKRTDSQPLSLESTGGEQHSDEDADTSSITQNVTRIIVLGFTLLVFLALTLNLLNPRITDRIPQPMRPIPHRTIEQRVKAILTETPLIDGHNDLAILLRARLKNNITSVEFREKFEKGGMPAHVDLPRLRKGMVGGAFWSAFVICPENASEDFSDEEYATEVSHTIQQIDLIKRLQNQYSQDFTRAGSSLETMLSHFHDTRSLFGPISIEGLHQVSQTSGMSTLRLYYELGVRAATLTWNCHNAFADAALISTSKSTKIAPYHRGGLTEKGRQLVKEMNRLGMLIDISHTSYWTQKAVLSNATSRSPVVFTHSSAFELCPHPRNVKNDILELVKDTNSIVMVNFSPDFISCEGDGVEMPTFYEQNNTLHQVARHITYIGDRIGYDHVGLGSDFDGIETTPRGLDGVDKYPDLIAELLRMGVSDEDASKVVGGNILRVWKDAEKVAAEMQKEGVEPGEDEVSGY